MPHSPERLQAIIEDADRCVKCAVCLPHCPTYRISGNEAESPRGRIALMRGLADGSQRLTPGLERHLDQCLTCRSCEPVCPAGVPYGRLLDNARAEQAARHGPSLRKRAGLAVLPRRRLLRLVARFAAAARRLGLARLLPALRRGAPRGRSRTWEAERPPAGDATLKVGLFVGCVADVLDAQTREAAVRLLNACGCHVVLPPNQTCCGALHQHSGLVARAEHLARRNRDAFESAGVGTVISTATGCGAQLAEHVFGDGHRDIVRWLVEGGDLQRLDLERLDAAAAVHVPCTQRNVIRDAEGTAELLSAIPGLAVELLPVDPKCCGAAGSYMLEHPAIADELGRMQARAIADRDPDYLVTANVGCALHLADHLRRLGSRAEVLHPVTLVARQLRSPEPK